MLTGALLYQKSYKALSNKEKEATYRVAHSGFFFGSFNAQHNITKLSNGLVRKNECKFCKQPKDSTKHVFYECFVIRQILMNLGKYFEQTYQHKIIFSKPIVLYNVAIGPHNIRKLVLFTAAVFRAIVLDEKIQLDSSNTFLSNRNDFVNKL